jgi:RHS repeat-associated protein
LDKTLTTRQNPTSGTMHDDAALCERNRSLRNQVWDEKAFRSTFRQKMMSSGAAPLSLPCAARLLCTSKESSSRRRCGLVANSGAPYQYDSAGNMIADGNHTYSYDAENELINVDGGTTATYYYDVLGRRVGKQIGSGVITEYLRDLAGNVIADKQGTNWATFYLYFGGGLTAEYTASTTEFISRYHLGSTRLVTAMDQSVVDSMDYLPFGEQTSGDTATTHKFTGKERDSESGLDNFGARYNASTMGRFMTPDPLGGHQEDPQTLNKYAYVRNNPLNLTDPTGLDLYLQGCGDASKTCKDNFVGTTDYKGNFTRTTIQSDASRNFDGHDVSFDSSGIHIDDKYQGVYAPGTDATRVNGDEHSGFAGTHFVVNSNCLGTCLAGGGLYSDNGGTSAFKGVIATLEGPNKGLDKYGDHPGDQYRGGNKNGPDAHLSYVTDQNGNPTNGMPFHIDTRNPFHSTGGFLGHTGDLIEYKFKAGILREQGPPMPADIRPKDNQ